jgi:hypothetical protein
VLQQCPSTIELTCDEFREILFAVALSLTYLELEGIVVRFTVYDDLSPVILPCLLHLDIRYRDFSNEDEPDDDYIAGLSVIIGAVGV